MDISYIMNEFEKKFKYIEYKDNKLVLSNSKYLTGELIPEYECNEFNSFTIERGEKIIISNMSGINLNILGLYCMFLTKERITLEENNELRASNNQQEIMSVFRKNFSEDYLSANLSFFQDELVDKAINVVAENNSFVIYFVMGDKKIKMYSFINNEGNVVYRSALSALKSKRSFEESFLSRINVSDLSNEDLLKLYSIFEYKTQGRVLDNSKKKQI